MKYSNGIEVLVGDKVRLSGDEIGQVVGLLEDNQFDTSVNANEWLYLAKGALIRSSKYGLFHYSEMNDDIVFISRT